MTAPVGRLVVVRPDGSHRLEGSWADVEMANAFLAHLEVRGFSPATVRAYAFDLLNFGRFLGEKELTCRRRGPDRLVRLLGLAGEAEAKQGRRSCAWPIGADRRRRR